MKEVNVWVKEKNYELPVTYVCPFGYEELVDHRIFETMDDVHNTLLALGRATKDALARGLACPRDTRKAIEHIESLSKY